MKPFLKYLSVFAFLFILLTGWIIQIKEYIPDNAKIYILEEYQTWIPDASWVNEIFQEQATQSISARKSYLNKIESTYSEVKKNGRYKGFELPESWKVGDYKSRIFWGKDQSLLRSWISPKTKRWNEDGTWNW